ncbi:MAG TPA: hypothetical protein DD687_13980, partial [Verrucomicrobiales bacterium]|nr:hypothetical protein [Verrucomicrobiales bacterium]
GNAVLSKHPGDLTLKISIHSCTTGFEILPRINLQCLYGRDPSIAIGLQWEEEKGFSLPALAFPEPKTPISI